VTFLDIGPKLLLPDGSLPADIMPDDASLTEKGLHIWAGAIQPIVVTFPLPPPPTGIPLTTYPVPDVGWYKRFEGNIDKLKDGPYDLVFDGDSITDNWQNRGASVWKENYGSIKAIDIAISGHKTQFLLWRLHHGDLAGQNPKLIVLMIGTNNGGGPEVAAAIKLLIREYETAGPGAHILLQAIFPRDHDANSPSRKWVKATHAILATYASDPRVTYIDFGDKFLEPDGTLSADIMPDFLHPSAKGYEIWANAIRPVIDKYFPPAAGK